MSWPAIPGHRRPLLVAGTWLILVAVALAARPVLPVDETRYLSVAWEMWVRGDFLVPHLNGEPYSHKPPLLFWLMDLGWAVFGVNEWWPRLVAPLFGLANLFLTLSFARRLWPGLREVDAWAPMILIGGVFWALFTTLTMFDMVLAFFTLLGLMGVLHSWRDGGWRGWALFGLCVGLGLLTKGPAILPHTLPVALLAPLWGRSLKAGPGRPATGWWRWYLGLAAALGLAVAIALAWAVPAAAAGGEAYRQAISWGQTAGRMVDSFAHGRPFWWYLAVLPPMFLPWLAWPALWRAAAGARRLLADGGVRFCLCWFLPSLVVFSMISGKQVHYLLPVFPAAALLMARLLGDVLAGGGGRRDHLLPCLLFSLLGGGAFLFAILAGDQGTPAWIQYAHPAWMLALGALGLALAVTPVMTPWGRLAVLSGLAATAVVTIHLAARPVLDRAFDLAPLAARLAQWEGEGRPLAHYGNYHGQFHFLGRLRNPIAIIGDQEAVDWLARNPTGKIVTYYRHPPTRGTPDLVQPFRNLYVVVWDATAVGDDPGLLMRSP